MGFFWKVDIPVPKKDAERALVFSAEDQPADPVDRLYQGMAQKLSQVTDFEQTEKLFRFFAMRPLILDSLPSCVPLYRESFVLSSPYGKRYHPIHKLTKNHFGVDLAAPTGTPIYCTAAGTVSHIGNDPKSLGNHVIITHANGFSTLYGHMEQVAVSIGERLPPHEYIGTVGSTGLSTGPHLHYETIKNGVRIDPMPSFNIKYEVYRRMSQTD